MIELNGVEVHTVKFISLQLILYKSEVDFHKLKCIL